jgi:hypothetical protein
MAGLRPMGPVSQRATIVLDDYAPMVDKDPGQGDGCAGSLTSAAVISASTLARPRQNARRPLIACSGGRSRGHSTSPTAPNQAGLTSIASQLDLPRPDWTVDSSRWQSAAKQQVPGRAYQTTPRSEIISPGDRRWTGPGGGLRSC